MSNPHFKRSYTQKKVPLELLIVNKLLLQKLWVELFNNANNSPKLYFVHKNVQVPKQYVHGKGNIKNKYDFESQSTFI